MRYLTNLYGRDCPYPDLQDYGACSLAELKAREAELLRRIGELREREPAGKRRRVREQQIWFSLCHGYLEELMDVRDAIAEKTKERPFAQKTE